MPGIRAEGIFEELKKFLSPGSIWQKVLVPQHDLLKSFGTPTTKLKIAQKVFVPLLQLFINFRAPDINKKNSKGFNSFFKLCLKMIFNNSEAIIIEHFLDDSKTALEIQVPFSSSISVLSI